MSYNPARRALPPSFTHLRRMTDDTGLLEHALGRTPRRLEGYTTDDNARALWVVTEWLSAPPEAGVTDEQRETLLDLASNYLAFMLWNQRDTGWWHNNVAYDKSPEKEDISHDCQGRSVWSCADAWVRLPHAHKEAAFAMFEKAMPTLSGIDSLRGQAYALASCVHVLEAEERGEIDFKPGWKEQLEAHVRRLEDGLIGSFRHFSDSKWRWFEPAMTYGNGVLPWSMLRAYSFTETPETLEIGLDSLSSLQAAMTSEEGWFRPIGNDGWCTSEAISRWDQQPLEMFKLALALDEGTRALDKADKRSVSLLVSSESQGSPRHRPNTDGQGRSKPAAEQAGNTVGIALAVQTGQEAGALNETEGSIVSALDYAAKLREARNRCLEWFHGDNDLEAQMADPEDGSCCDGLQENGPNLNCGAESTISYLMTQAFCSRS